MEGKFFISLMLMIFMIPVALAIDYSPMDQNYVKAGESQSHYFTEVHSISGSEYVGINKNSGDVEFTIDGSYAGKMLPVIAGLHPITLQWYLCPIRQIDQFSVDVGENSLELAGRDTFMCYQWENWGNTASITINITSLYLETSKETGDTKMSLNVTLENLLPLDTGAGILFYPDDVTKFRYARINGEDRDLAGVEGDVPVDKVVEFLDGQGLHVGNSFDWNDMPNGTPIAKIVQLFGKKGLIYGSYGWGSSSVISFDPIFTADFSPTPAEWLISGFPSVDPDSEFDIILDITSIMSDNSTASKVETRDFGIEEDQKAIVVRFNETFDAGFNWFLRLRKETPGNREVKIYGYNDSDNLSEVLLTDLLSGTGYFSVPVDTIMAHEFANTSLNHSDFRFTTDSAEIFWSEVRLRKKANDTEPPEITSCLINDTTLSEDEKARLQCTITDNLDVDGVVGDLDGFPINFTKEEDIYYYDFLCDDDSIGNHTWNNITAMDILGLVNETDVNLSFSCEETPFVTGFSDCDLSSNPVIGFGRKVPFVCYMNDSLNRECVASVYANGTILSTSPEAANIDGIGLVASFDTERRLLHGYYDQFFMRPEQNFTVEIRCGIDTFNKVVSPIQKGLIEVEASSLWFRDNLGLLIGFGLLIALVIGVLVWGLKGAGVIR